MAPLLPNQPSPLSAMENVNELTSDLSISRTGSAESSSSSRAEELSYREYQAHMRVKAARGDSRLRVAETKTDLATDLNDAGEYEKASEELKEAIAIYEELRPEGNGIRVQLAATYDLLATVYKHQGRTKEALEQCQKCLVVGIKTMGWDHRDMAARYGNIGSVLSSLGKHEMALEQHQKCLEVQVKTLGAEHSSLAVTHGNIGSVYWKQSKHEQALASFTLSVAIYRKLCLVFDDQVTYKGALAEYTQCVTMLSAKVRQDASKSLPGAADITDAGSDNLKVGKGFTARFRRASIVVGETIGKFSERLSSSEGRLSSSDTTDRLSSSESVPDTKERPKSWDQEPSTDSAGTRPAPCRGEGGFRRASPRVGGAVRKLSMRLTSSA